VGAATAIQYVYDAWNLIADYSGTTVKKTYVWGMDISGSMQGAGGVGGLLSVKDETATATYYPTYDGNGNISEYLDVNGDDVAHYEYEAFGNMTVSIGTKEDYFLHRFSTKPLDDVTGLYYYGYRYYDPVTGRWLSRDPIQERGGLNLYNTISNDLIGYFDVLDLVNWRKKGPAIPREGDWTDSNSYTEEFDRLWDDGKCCWKHTYERSV
jgi:RHS repeat-associated protein